MIGRRIIGLMLTCVVLSVETQELSSDVLKVAHAMTTNRDLLKRLKLYTCLETIERYRPGAQKHAKLRDAIQLDVGVGDGHEMYSWPGEASFSSMDLGALVGHGLLATGVFSGFAKDLFLSNNVIVRFAGEKIIQGHRALQFSYQESSLTSHWQIQWHGKAGQVGEAGVFWVNPTDFHILRLMVAATEIPPQMLLQSLTLIVNYQTVANTLVPTDASLDAVESAGAAYHNSVEFSHCHVFEAQSAVLDPSVEAMAAVLNDYKKKEGMLPPGLTLRVELDEPVEVEGAMVGNVVRAHLDSAVALPDGLVIPKGATLHGRIRRFELLDQPPNTYCIGIEFSELAWDDHDFRFLSQLQNMDSLRGISAIGPGSEPVSGGADESTKRTIESSPLMENDSRRLDGAEIPGAAVLFLSNAQSIPKGFRMVWQTKKMLR